MAWVRVQFSLQQRTEELKRLWSQSLLAIILLVALVLIGLQMIVSRALRPIISLSKFAQQMPLKIGAQIEISPGCLEVNQLASSLNLASRGIAEQVGRVQAIVNTAAEAIIGLDANGLVATANPAASSFLDVPSRF